MAEFPIVSVISVTWNRQDDILDLLTHLQKQTCRAFETIVVDNGSQDTTSLAIRRAFPDTRLIQNLENMAPTSAYNRAIQIANGKYVVVVDSDALLANDVLERVVAEFERDNELGIAACRIVDFYTTRSAWDNPVHDPDLVKGSCPALAFNGNGVAFRSDVFKRVGLLSEEFHSYLYELEFSTRVAQAGFKIRFFPDMVAFHKSRSLAGQSRSQLRAYFVTRNLIWYSWKFFPVSSSLRFITLIVWAQSLRAIFFRSSAFLRGMRDGIKGITSGHIHRQVINVEYQKQYSDQIYKNTALDWKKIIQPKTCK